MTSETQMTLLRYLSHPAKREKAFQSIYNAYRGYLHTQAYRKTGDLDAADDIVQNVFIRFLNRGNFQEITALPAYLSKICHHLCLRYLAERNRRQQLHRDASTTMQQSMEPDYVNPEIRDRFVAVLDKLPAKQKWAVYLIHWEQWTLAEAAELLDMPLSTFRFNLQRGVSTVLPVLEPFRFHQPHDV